ncbi:MAG TPA: acireductone synthase [Candidatus Competibacteraceae bacterium]|nr:acireductone synthase [Candidatus Competibacteraceae bacterium]
MAVKAIVTDIEGTTSSIRFVHEVLFPYSRARMAQFLRAHAGDPEVAEQLARVSAEVGRELSLEQATAQLLEWLAQDRKIGPLKTLQGMIWEQGYRQGDFHGHVYSDAVAGLRRWHARDIPLYVYSSGSVHAQKLLFAHTAYGDLTTLFSGHFDTAIGGKRETESYRRIQAALGLPAEAILFLSDVVEELDAAREAGLQTAWLVREGALTPDARHPQYRDFDAILPD